MHSLHHMPAILIRELSTSEKRLSAPIYPEMAIVDGEEIKTVEEENNLLSGDLERLNGRIPTVSITKIDNKSSSFIQCYKNLRRSDSEAHN